MFVVNGVLVVINYLFFFSVPPPPSYAAATSVTIPQSEEYDGPTTYAPQYNYYDWSQSAFSYN